MIKRFRYDFKSGIVADGKGDFISYAEYEVLQQKLVAVTEQRDALVVENVALKKVISDVQGVYYKSDGVAGYHLNGQIATWDEVMPDLWEIETPATDAAIASLRAEGVEMLAEKFRNDRKDLDPEIFAYGEVSDHFNKAAYAAEKFARQLRESKVEVSNG